MRPLEGLVVLDFSTLLPGPLATLLLAEAGAEVIKVERPGTGEELRGYDPRWGRSSALFALLNRGKRSLALDLKSPADRARLEPLLAKADVLVEQFRPGVMDRLGLGYDQLQAQHPRLVYCSITGYGQTGPWRDRAGHDLNYMAESGLLALSSGPADRPVVPPALVADIAGGAYPAFMNVLLALRERDRTGRGRHLDVAMAENVLPFAFWAFGEGFAGGRWPGNADALLSGGGPRYRLYPTRDGRLLAVGAIEQKFWDNFCRLVAVPEHLRDDRPDPSATAAAVGRIVAGADAAHWAALLADEDCCVAVVADLAEALASPHFRARGVFAHAVGNEGGATMPALPTPLCPAFRGEAGVARAPALGEFEP